MTTKIDHLKFRIIKDKIYDVLGNEKLTTNSLKVNAIMMVLEGEKIIKLKPMEDEDPEPRKTKKRKEPDPNRGKFTYRNKEFMLSCGCDIRPKSEWQTDFTYCEHHTQEWGQ